MSILENLGDLLSQERLLVRPSSFTGFETARTMIVLPEISAITVEPFADTIEGERLGQFAEWLDSFSEYGAISVSESPKQKPQDAMLARVCPVADEFWSIRVTDPPGTEGIRALGAFAGTDMFVALDWAYREDMDFDESVADVQQTWRDLFGTVNPHGGSRVDDYLTNYILV